MKRKSVKLAVSLISGLTLIMMLGAGCTGTLNADPLDDGGYLPMVERFAERFDLDPDEVMDFVEELREERIAEMEANFEEELDELVEKGEITDEQKQAILDKKEEMKAFRESLEDMTVADAREALAEMKEDLKDWAEENDIGLKYLFPRVPKRQEHKASIFFGFGGRR
jgi:polyhydroxyalkanoate synthesis regulator phasin